MKFLRWSALTLTAIALLILCGCGGSTNPPAALSYSITQAVYTKGVPIPANNPTSTNRAVDSFSVSPALPAGLSLNPSSGVLSGTPTALAAIASYAITAFGPSVSTTATLNITVNDQPPAALSYTTSTAIYDLRTQIAPNRPTSTGGAVTSYRVSPAFPAGLSLSANTGVISGILATAAAQANYTVTASNSGGSATTKLTIAAAKVLPTQMAIACGDLMQLNYPNTQITKAQLIAANTTKSTSYPSAPDLPEHCLVQGVVGARTGALALGMDQYGNLNGSASSNEYGIGFELRMPTTIWNGDFFVTGGGGDDGTVSEAVGATLGGVNAASVPALYQGFAVITQNSGHSAGTDELGQGRNQNNGFGYDPQARRDYGYQQTGTMTPIAKSILSAFYGKSPYYSYYLGCSNGGREAMVASQRWGDMFDGVVAGDPGFRLPHAAIAEAWDTQQFAQAAQAVENDADPLDANENPSLISAASSADLALVGQLVLAKCDALDNVVDGMIFNTATCKQQFDPSTLSSLQCPTSTKAPGCLLGAQITAIQKVFAGPTDSQAKSLYSDWPYDVGISDPKWMMWPIGIPQLGNIAQNVSQGASSTRYIFTSPVDPTLNVFTVTMDDLNKGINATDSTFTESAVQFMEATSTDLSKLTAHNGKIIYYHGESDPVFSMYDTVNYYNSLSAAYGTSTANFARLFLVPGMNHCSGGYHTLDSFDLLTAIVNWVEAGKAPDSVIASVSNTPTFLDPVTMTRPLCPYPQYAKYTAGDTSIAANFKCVAPAASTTSASGVGLRQK